MPARDQPPPASATTPRRAARRRPSWLRLVIVALFMVAGLMIAMSAVSSQGSDLRPARSTELAGLVRVEADRADDLRAAAAALQAEVDALTRAENGAQAAGPSADQLAAAAELAAATVVRGPAVTVTLTDAPDSVRPAGVADDLLVVHQQDIQAAVNALWQGGAEAMTIQGQRVSSRTGIKCVGNTVVLHGVPYAPPYVITAIGDQEAMEQALDSSDYLALYREYVDAYRLGFDVKREADVTLPAYDGASGITHARVVR